MAQPATDKTPGQHRATARRTTLRWFFVSMASVLFVIVAIGFAPSFYLRGVLRPPRAGAPSYPLYLIAHGILLTLWYLLFLTQALLVASRRIRIHRSLGIAGAAVAAVLVPLSLFVVIHSVARSNLGALPVIGDFGILLLFTVLVTLSIRYRRKPEVHKRLMLIASIGLVAPAIARWPGAEAALPLSVVVPQLTMYAALIVNDFVTRRRLHPATGWGVAAYIVIIGTAVPLAMSDLGRTLVNALKSQ